MGEINKTSEDAVTNKTLSGDGLTITNIENEFTISEKVIDFNTNIVNSMTLNNSLKILNYNIYLFPQQSLIHSLFLLLQPKE